jgi:Gas vesicle protein
MAEKELELSLLETLDHLLDRGVVIAGEATISIGDVDLLYLGLNIVLANVDAVIRTGKRAERRDQRAKGPDV